MTKAKTIYAIVAVLSFVCSNIWVMHRNNAFEAELVDKYEDMIHSLKDEFAGQKELIESINREEIAWYQDEFAQKLQTKRTEFHQELTAAHGDIGSVRQNVHIKHKESKKRSEQSTYLQRENADTRDHYNKIRDIAQNHVSDLEDQIVECEHKNRRHQTEMSQLL